MTIRKKKIYRTLTYFFVTALLFHIFLAAFLIGHPNKNYLTTSSWEKAYRLFGLTGPFFSEDRINVIPRVYYSVKEKKGSWALFEEFGIKEFQRFHGNYLRYDQLLLSGLPRYLCRQIQVYNDTTGQEKYLQSIKRYIVLSNPEVEIDSATLVYTLDSFVDAKSDTFFIKHIGFAQLPRE